MTVLRTFLKVAAAAITLVILLGVAAIALLRTETGERLVRERTERIASAAIGDDFTVRFGEQRLTLDALPRLGIGFGNTTLRDRRTGAVLATIADLTAGIDLRALLTGHLAVERLAFDGVRLDKRLFAHLSTTTDFSSDAVFSGLDRVFANLNAVDLQAFAIRDLSLRGDDGQTVLAQLSMDRSGAGGFSLDANGTVAGTAVAIAGTAGFDSDAQKLTALDISGDPVVLAVPSKLLAPEAQTGTFDLPTRASLKLTSIRDRRRLAAALAANWHETGAVPGGRAGGKIVLAEGAAMLDISDAHFETSGVAAGFSGHATLRSDATGRYAVSLRTNRLTSTIGQTGESRSSADLALTVSAQPQSGRISLDRFEFAASGGEMEASGTVGGLDADNHLRATLSARRLKAADVLAFWPAMIAPKARSWALDNLRPAGMVTTASLEADITLERVARIVHPHVGPKKDELSLSADFVGLGFATFGDLPVATDAAGHIDYRGGKTVVSIAGARFVDLPGIAVLPSSIEFDRADDGVATSLSVNLSGKASELLRLADRKPIDALGKAGWKSDDVSGTAKAWISAALLLGEGTTDANSDVILEGWTVIVDANNVDLDRRLEGRQIDGVTGTISLAPGTAIGTVDARIDGVPATVEFSQPLGLAVGTATFRATAALDAAELRRVLPQVSVFVDGPVSVTVTREGTGTHATVVLDDAEIALDAIGWMKGVGIPARLDFDVAASGDTITLDNARLAGEGFFAEGTVETDEGGVARVTLDRAKLNRDDDFSARIERTQNGFAVAITGRSLDARPILASLRDGLGIAASDAGGASSQPREITATIAVDRLSAFGDETLEDARISYRNGAGVQVAADLSAVTTEGRRVALTVGTSADERKIDLVTDDLGSLLRFTGLYSHMTGGRAHLGLTGTGGDGLVGSVRIENFSLVDEPRMARLAGTTRSDGRSLSQVTGRDFDTASVDFDSAAAALTVSNGRLTVSDGILRGPVFGSSFEGVPYDRDGRIEMTGAFMPAYSINRIFGELPLLGEILGNGNEGGLIGITYRLSGAFADPTLTINPISAIAPGVFRRIFEY